MITEFILWDSPATNSVRVLHKDNVEILEGKATLVFKDGEKRVVEISRTLLTPNPFNYQGLVIRSVSKKDLTNLIGIDPI